ncbi:MAG: VCBS repeat-containing protein [Deltaproteobacteria bacterium]|nr:VCBS repeat-containing protein [Deltaproteobacteria bacterium]
MTSRALPLLTLLLGCRAEDTQRFTSGLDSIDTGLGLTLTGMSGEAALQPAARIARDGLWLSLPDEELHLRTARWGREGGLIEAGDAAPGADGCWVEAPGRLAVLGCTPALARSLPGGVERWRAVGAATQQGWTFDEAPSGAGPLLIEVEVQGAELGLDGDTVWLSTVGGQRLRYDSLRAWDDTGVPLESWMTVAGDRVQIWVDDTDARWPVHVDPILSTATTSISRSTDTDFGLGVTMGGDVNKDGYVDLLVGARFGVGLYGTAYSYHGSSSGISTTASRSYLSTGYYGKFGEALDNRGDVNNDGYDDAVISEFYNEIIFVYHGSSSGLPASPNTTLYSGSYGAGRNVAWAGDINNDSYDDLVVASEDDVIVYKGSSSGLNTTGVKTHLGTSGFTASGAGDVNNDGYADYIYGDSGANRAYVVLGNSSFTGSSTTLSASGASYLGETVAGVGDLNGDGYDEVAAADTQYSSAKGRVVVYYGSSSGTRTTGTVTIDGGSSGLYSGAAIVGAGDVNGDGYDDMLIGGYGRVSLYHGSSSGVSTTASQTISGGGGTFGFTMGGLRSGADVNKDGFDDVVIGDFGSKTVYVYYGCQDADGDGECAPTDCNDTNAAINTSATEVCDASNTDEDCDGLTDDSDSSVSSTGKTRYYKDADSDGYGDKSDAGSLRCDVNSTYKVTTNTDCNDSSSSISPGATEICDSSNTDEDCDSLADNNDSSASSATKTTYYKDADGDGYGDKSDTGAAYCDATSTYKVTNKTDCNDSSSSISPAATEVCDASNTDEDCDGLSDDSDSSVSSSGKTTYYKDADSDGYGDKSDTGSALCDVSSTYKVTTKTDCNDSSSAINPAATEVCDASNTDEDCDGLADNNDTSASSATKTTYYKDADSDGYGDKSDTGAAYCDATSTYKVTTKTDCNDSVSAINPGATEVCDASNTDEDCDGLSDDSDSSASSATKTTYYKDADGDGYGDKSDTGSALCDVSSTYKVTTKTDCNDSSSAINPGATEVCDASNTDEDCDGLSDDADSSVSSSGKTTYYKDADSDGYGDKSDTGSALCDVSSTYKVTTKTDCNDSVSAINPAATEVCDASNTDEDCDGLADDADSSVSSATKTTYYKDADSDGYGDKSDTGAAYCDTTSTYKVTTKTDCNDAVSAINPGATEVCDASDTDEDCDGLADDADSSVSSSGKTTYYKDADSDGYGDKSDTGAAYCDTTSTYKVTTKTDCDDSVSAINPGATEVCDASDTDEDCDGLADDADSSVSASSKTSFYKDADGDGFGDETDPGQARCDDSTGYPTDDNSDCDDADAAINPDATEILYDGVDQDCDGGDIADADGDGQISANAGGEDCDDTDADIYAGATEIWYDGVDQDCDESSDYDADGDGQDHDGYGGTDCDDTDDTVYLGAEELADGLDNDCDGEVEILDADGDGLNDTDELPLGTDPQNPDTDGDGLSDGEEVLTLSTDPLDGDSDADGLSDGEEVNEHGTDPVSADSDDGGVNDGEEVDRGSDPLNSADDDLPRSTVKGGGVSCATASGATSPGAGLALAAGLLAFAARRRRSPTSR